MTGHDHPPHRRGGSAGGDKQYVHSSTAVVWGTRLALVSAVVFAALKIVAFQRTNSLAVLSDLLDSAVNITAAVAVGVAVHYGQRPADEDHPYGHQKVENLAAILEAGLVLLTAGSFVVLAFERLHHPAQLSHLVEGAVLEAIVSIGTVLVALYLLKVGRAHSSVALVADGQHLMADVVTTVAVVVGVVAVHLTGLVILDTVLTIGIVAYLAWVAITVLVGAVRPLLDEALPPAELATILEAAALPLRGASLHRLRTRRAGAVRFVDAIVTFPTHVTLAHAHHVANDVEAAITAAFPDGPVDVHLHLEPPGAHGTPLPASSAAADDPDDPHGDEAP